MAESNLLLYLPHMGAPYIASTVYGVADGLRLSKDTPLAAKRQGNHAVPALHIVKLSVGTDDIADLAAWQATPRAQSTDGLPRHVTRMWPRREAEVLAGGSVFWVIKGVITCRQRIRRLDPYDGADGIRRCAIVLDPAFVRVEATPKRAFQGWRYLTEADAPRDLPDGRQSEEALPPDLSKALADIGVR